MITMPCLWVTILQALGYVDLTGLIAQWVIMCMLHVISAATDFFVLGLTYVPFTVITEYDSKLFTHIDISRVVTFISTLHFLNVLGALVPLAVWLGYSANYVNMDACVWAALAVFLACLLLVSAAQKGFTDELFRGRKKSYSGVSSYFGWTNFLKYFCTLACVWLLFANTWQPQTWNVYSDTLASCFALSSGGNVTTPCILPVGFVYP